jgi:hypothetical protein
LIAEGGGPDATYSTVKPNGVMKGVGGIDWGVETTVKGKDIVKGVGGIDWAV